MVDPTATVVITPLLLILAILVLEEDHGLIAAGDGEPDNCTVLLLIQISVVPLIVGNGLMVTLNVCAQPLELVYVIALVP